ncbi:hypothetical protein EW026_g8228 [Hermanssonia centrifuga]|uniref:Uncharacterized protein n=1 Tax=Hermanssonia centrifuga TaxID=98765 RepID=A0A4S4K523_9APHY|nr:hypothetical protein EW026_g8228 [Hermanssonia centrifuga]
MRAALRTPTPKGAGGKGKMLIIAGQQAGGGKRKSEGALNSGNKKPKPPQHLGFCEGYAAGSSSKGKGIQVDKGNNRVSDSAIEDFDDFSDGEFDKGAAVKVEEEAIVISSDNDGEGGNNMPGRQLLFGHHMTTEGMVHILDDQSSKVGELDKIRPWPRLADREAAQKPVRSDLPIPYDQHKKFAKVFIQRVLRWLGEQPATFNIAYINLLRPMQDAWDLIFPNFPHQIDLRGATYDITLQKTYDWRSAIGRSAIEIVTVYFQKQTDLLTDIDCTIWVEEMVKKGNKLPLVYACTEKMPDGINALQLTFG